MYQEGMGVSSGVFDGHSVGMNSGYIDTGATGMSTGVMGMQHGITGGATTYAVVIHI